MIEEAENEEVGAEVSMEEAHNMMKCYFLYVEGEETVLQTENRRYITLIKDLKDTLKEKEDFAEKDIRVTAYEPIPHPETGRQGLAERTILEGKPKEVIEALQAGLLSKEAAAGAVIAGLSQVYERSTLAAGSHTLVFEEEEGPTCTGNTFAPTGATPEALNVLVNAMFGHAEQFTRDLQQKLGKQLILPAADDNEIILPGDPRFRRKL